MSEEKGHYYTSCLSLATDTINREKGSGSWLFLAQNTLLILGHIADRLADLVLAVEEQTQAIISPDRPGLRF